MCASLQQPYLRHKESETLRPAFRSDRLESVSWLYGNYFEDVDIRSFHKMKSAIFRSNITKYDTFLMEQAKGIEPS